jgi:regulator of RNase E activity RraA
MAARMKYLGVKGALVNGRVRDLSEIRECQLPVSIHGLLFLFFILLCIWF